ncbi:ABC transporter substrate-binding protein [Bifidobacterium sp. DSM 109958]|uniref:ABC transporter substrate-binding protein n=1 Tax=Bifidobacterium moraviense TaxID=2675323 RepID=A0A7Y0F216_9BIFI|nr:ABC transporter substrate-binding protein [Bifidobacterium sp. DSM 109958]NMN00409.1 ABC transporter substrate-binding protein [Bifidobacterium sp. DSM 109958]
MKKSVKLFAASVCAATMLLSACGGSGNTTADATGSVETDPNAIINAYGCEPQNPLITTNTNETCGGNPIDLMYAKLVAFDNEGNAKNEVADSITANEDNTVYTIKLKDGWKFTDGTPVTAESFTKAWSYGANAKNAQVSSGFFANIAGYDDLQNADALTGNEQLSGLKVEDDKTFTVTLSAASSTFPIQVGYTAFAPLPESFFQDPASFGEHPVGNGQYKFDSWNHNQDIKLVRNDDYKGNFPAKNGGIDFKVYTDTEPAYADVSGGNLDIMDTVPNSAVKTFQSDGNVQAINNPGSVFQSFTFAANMKHFGLDQEGRLRRQAISMAIDRNQVNEKLNGNLNTVATEWTSPVTPGYNDKLEGNDVLTYNPDKAKQLWEQANAISAWGADDKFQIAYNADNGSKDQWDAICNQISKTLGITAEGAPYPTFKEMRTAVSKRQITTAFRSGWQPDYPSPESYLVSLYASSAADGNGSNDGDYKNPAFDDFMAKAAAAKSTDEANKFYQQGEQILFQDMPAVPLWYTSTKAVAAKNVQNVATNWKNEPDYASLAKPAA